MKVRNAKDINKALGHDAIIAGFTPIPVPSYLKPSIKDDVAYQGCNYIQVSDTYYFLHEETFAHLKNKFLSVLQHPL